MSHKKTSNFHQILRNLTIELKQGDQISIWHDGYQVSFKNVGTSNFKTKTPQKQKQIAKN
jgi:hypothetical protein